MKKVTVNGVDHLLSPDSPRARSHSQLLDDIVTSVNELESGQLSSGIDMVSTNAADNVITSASNDTTTTSSVAAMTFKNTTAHSTNDLEFQFLRSDDTSLLKIDKEGDATIGGALTVTSSLSAAGVSSSGATTALTSTSANVITSATTDANTTSSVAGLTLKNTAAHTTGDLEFDFQLSTGASLLEMSDTTAAFAGAVTTGGAVTASGSVSAVGGFTGSSLTTPVAGAFTTAETGGSLADATSYFYRVSAYNAVGETLAFAEVEQATGAGPTGTHTITVVWGTVPGAVGYNVYGRSTGAEEFIAAVAQGTLSYTDTGAVSPSGALPAVNTTGGLVMSGALPNIITSNTSDSNASSSVASLTFKNAQALTSGDLEFSFQKSTGAALLTISDAGPLAPLVEGTKGSGTGITAGTPSALRTVLHKVTVTEAALTDEDTSQAVTIWTVPAKTRILRVVADVTAAFTGGGNTACTLQVGISGGDADAYLAAFDCFSGATTKGLVEADLGVALGNGGSGVGAFPDFTGAKAIDAQFDSTTGTVAGLTAGSVTFYIECVTY